MTEKNHSFSGFLIFWMMVLPLAMSACKQAASEKNAGNNAGANGLSGTTRCDTMTASGVLCYEYTGLQESGFSVAKASCDQSKGTFTAKAACSRANNVGGCTQGVNGGNTTAGKLVIYVYAPNYTAEKVKQLCQSENEHFVQP